MVAASLLGGLFKALTGLIQGFGFGTGYGAGVRFGFEDVYPYFRGQAGDILKFLGVNTYARSGYKSGAGFNSPPTRQGSWRSLG